MHKKFAWSQSDLASDQSLLGDTKKGDNNYNNKNPE